MQGFFCGVIMGINKLYSNSVINNLMFIIGLVVCSIVGAGPLAVVSLAFHLIFAGFIEIYIIFILILMIYLFKTLNKNEKTKDLKIWLIIFFSIPLLLLAGYPLLLLEEYITGIDSGEKYLLGVLLYLCVPAVTGYLSLAFVWYVYKGKSVFKTRVITAFIYFIITVIFGFSLLIKAYSYT